MLARHHSQTFHLRVPQPFQGDLPGSWAVGSMVGVGWSLKGKIRCWLSHPPLPNPARESSPGNGHRPTGKPGTLLSATWGRALGCGSQPCPAPPYRSLPFDPSALSLPSWLLGEGAALPSGGSLWAAPLLNQPLTPSPVVCGWDGQKLQGSREPGSRNSVPSVLWHPGQCIRLRSVSWAWGQVYLSLAHLICTNTRCTTV